MFNNSIIQKLRLSFGTEKIFNFAEWFLVENRI